MSSKTKLCKAIALLIAGLGALVSFVIVVLQKGVDISDLLDYRFYLTLIWLLGAYFGLALVVFWKAGRSVVHCRIILLGAVLMATVAFYSWIIIFYEWDNSFVAFLALFGFKTYQWIIILMTLLALFVYKIYIAYKGHE